MPATYVDQVEKLDIRSMMAAALKGSPSHSYAVYRDQGAWRAAAAADLAPSAHQLVARIKLDRAPGKGTRPSGGQVLLSMVLPDGITCEQTLWLVAVPIRNGGLRWTTFCPYSHHRAQTLYLSLEAQQFVTRQVAGLKYRRRVRKVRNFRARMFAIMRELEADHRGPDIPKPVWMVEPLYQQLMEELVEMDCRVMCRALKRPPPDFWAEPCDYASATPDRANYPRSKVLFYVKNGVPRLKAKYRKRYGLRAAT
jgi:hypothetical protein